MKESEDPPLNLRHDRVAWCLRLTAMICLLGYGLRSLFGHGPWLEEVFWQPAWMKPMVQTVFGLSWSEYLQSMGITHFLGWITVGIGAVYAISGVMALVMRPRWLAFGLLVLSTVLMGTEAYGEYYSHGHRIFQFSEYVLRFLAPLLAFGVAARRWRGGLVRWVMAAAIAITFLSHGIWALNTHLNFGFISLNYPTPGPWIDMVLKLWPVTTEARARLILQIAGWLDLGVAIAILIPRLWRVALMWAIIWGGLTALARTAAHVDLVSWLTVGIYWDGLLYWISTTMQLVPHFGVPLALWWMKRAELPLSR